MSIIGIRKHVKKERSIRHTCRFFPPIFFKVGEFLNVGKKILRRSFKRIHVFLRLIKGCTELSQTLLILCLLSGQIFLIFRIQIGSVFAHENTLSQTDFKNLSHRHRFIIGNEFDLLKIVIFYPGSNFFITLALRIQVEKRGGFAIHKIHKIKP